jgi:hypothetical protein
MVDVTKAFVKKNAALIPAGETVLAAVLADAKGGAWRRGMQQAGSLTDAIASLGKSNEPQEGVSGDAHSWPEGTTFWLVLTDKHLHVFPGLMGVGKALPGGVVYPLDRIGVVSVDKKLMISKLHIAFKDGSAVELDLAKQNVKAFIEAAQSRIPVS